jgi:hypothetical protein
MRVVDVQMTVMENCHKLPEVVAILVVVAPECFDPPRRPALDPVSYRKAIQNTDYGGG